MMKTIILLGLILTFSGITQIAQATPYQLPPSDLQRLQQTLDCFAPENYTSCVAQHQTIDMLSKVHPSGLP